MAEYKVVKPPRRQLGWKGWRARPVCEIKTGAYVVPASTLGTVRWCSNGYVQIDFDPCTCCGIGARVAWKRIAAPDRFQFVVTVEADLVHSSEAA